MVKVIFKSLFGSHLYGTYIDSVSDVDYKGVYLPNKEDLILQRVRKSIRDCTKTDSSRRNTSEDVDNEIYSLHYFLDMGYKNITTFMDMIHTPNGFEDIGSPEWRFLRENRSKFYTKSMESLLQYSQHQAARYGVRGSRIHTLKAMISYFVSVNYSKEFKLKDIWDELPLYEHMSKSKLVGDTNKEIQECYYEICSRKFQPNTSVGTMIEVLSKILDNYGDRARLAEESNGVDWKAISHSFRACYQLKEIYETGDLVYPLKDKNFLLNIKQGTFHYKNNRIGEQLEELIEEVKQLSEKSKYPESVDKKFFEDWLLSLY